VGEWESGGVGEKTTKAQSRWNFTPSLPHPLPHSPLAPSPLKPKLRLLLAEDNLVNQKVALRQLQTLGYTADVAANGKEVLQLLEKIPYDLILMDCQMPVLDGLEATREIHRRQDCDFANGRRPVVVAMTANAMKEDQQKCREAGMDDYLSKPVFKDKLAAMLEFCCKDSGRGLDREPFSSSLAV